MFLILLGLFLFACFSAGICVFARSSCVSLELGEGEISLQNVSLVVPARNEERNLPKLLASLERELPLIKELIVVDDHSSDSTARLAREFGARVIQAPPLPESWTGKNWACHQGARVAQGNLLCFVDADVEFEAGGLQRLIAEKQRGAGAALSVLPYHVVERPYEQLSSFFNVLMAMGTGAFAARQRETKLVGQFLCIDRASYFLSGGHESVRDRILENFSMSQNLKNHGIKSRTLLGRGVLRMRMFPDGFVQLWEGWGKAFARGSQQAPRGALLASVLWAFGPMTVFTLLFFSPTPWSFVFGFWILFVFQIAVFFARVGSFSRWGAVFFPVPLLFYQLLFFFSLAQQNRGARVRWRGRSFPAASSDSEASK